MCVLSRAFLAESPRRFVSLRRARNAARSQEKEKPAKFANGSLLGNDSRIFVQHHGAYPLSRMRPSSSTPSHALFLFSSLSFRPFLFFKVLPSRDAGVLHPFTFYFALSRVFDASPSCHVALYFRFRVCILDFLSFTYHLSFCNNNVPTPPSPHLRTLDFLGRFFSFFMLSPFLPCRDSAACPFRVHHGVLYIPVGNCPSFLASPTFIAIAQHADTIARIKPFVQFHFSRRSRWSECHPRFCHASPLTLPH